MAASAEEKRRQARHSYGYPITYMGKIGTPGSPPQEVAFGGKIMDLSNGGVGIEISVEEGVPQVISAIDGTPAAADRWRSVMRQILEQLADLAEAVVLAAGDELADPGARGVRLGPAQRLEVDLLAGRYVRQKARRFGEPSTPQRDPSRRSG
jgi:hypothetical protein